MFGIRPGSLTGGAVNAQAAAESARLMNELAQRQRTGEPPDSEWKSDGHGGQVYRRTISTGPLPKQRDS